MKLNIRVIIRIVGIICIVIGLFMLPSVLVAFIYNDELMLWSFLKSALCIELIGFIFYFISRKERQQLKRREGFLVVIICWFGAAFLGTLPYLFAGAMPSFIDVFFEATSDLTTTGVSLLSDVSSLPKPLLFWRGTCNWLGGMGILIFAVSVLPALGIGASNLANAETSASGGDKISERISESAKGIYIVYIGLTVMEIILLSLGDFSFFEACFMTFGSMGNSMLPYKMADTQSFSLYSEIIITIFCTVAAIGFPAYVGLSRGRIKDFFKDSEIRTFFTISIVAIVLVVTTLKISGVYDTWSESMHYGIIQTLAFSTTGGYASTNYELWPSFTHSVLLIVTFIGGCSQSTAGGLKAIRIAVVVQLVRRNIYKRIHPRAVVAVKLGDNVISADKAQNITAFFMLYLLTFGVMSMIVSIDGQNIGTTFSAVLATLSNTGLGFGEVGYGSNWNVFSDFGKVMLSINMIMGRLELFAIVLMFSPKYWRPDR